MHSLLSTIGAYPHVALLVVFLIACAESIAIVGTLVPAAIVMFSAGAMIGAGSLELWATMAAAALGAVMGDGLSYEMGRAQEARITSWRVLERYRDALTHGEEFIRKHGSTSILLARFTGPIRAFVPLLAGFAHMPRIRFYPVNVVSALLWAPAHILPGVLFGASLQMARAVSERLAIILLILVILIWFAAWLIRAVIRFGVPRLRRLRDAVVARARVRDTLLSRITLALLDPNRPGSHALLLLTVLLLAAGWLFLGVLEDVLSHDPLIQVDLAVFHFLQGLRTSSVDRLMVAVTEMGSVGIMLPLAIIVALWLALASMPAHGVVLGRRRGFRRSAGASAEVHTWPEASTRPLHRCRALFVSEWARGGKHGDARLSRLLAVAPAVASRANGNRHCRDPVRDAGCVLAALPWRSLAVRCAGRDEPRIDLGSSRGDGVHAAPCRRKLCAPWADAFGCHLRAGARLRVDRRELVP